MIAEQVSKQRRTAIMALVLVNAVWGLSFPIMKALNLEVDQHFQVTEPNVSTALRLSSASWMIAIRFAGAFLAFVLLFPKVVWNCRRHEWLAGVAIGSFFYGGLVLQVIGLATIPASRSGFLTSLSVIFTPLIVTLLQRRSPSWRAIVSIFVALFGVAILTGLIEFSGGRLSIPESALQRWTLGDSLTTLAALFFSGQIMLVDRLGKQYNSFAFTPGMFLATGTLAALTFLCVQPWIPESTSPGWDALFIQPRFLIPIGILGSLASVLAFSWMNKYQPHVTATQAAVIYTLEPVCVSIWAMFLPGVLSAYCGVDYRNEIMAVPLLIGGGCVLLANLLALLPDRHQEMIQ